MHQSSNHHMFQVARIMGGREHSCKWCCVQNHDRPVVKIQSSGHEACPSICSQSAVKELTLIKGKIPRPRHQGEEYNYIIRNILSSFCSGACSEFRSPNYADSYHVTYNVTLHYSQLLLHMRAFLCQNEALS